MSTEDIPSDNPRAPFAFRTVLVVGIPLLIFCAAFFVQGLKGWPNVLSAAVVELTPAFLLGRLVWLFAPRISRSFTVHGLVRHAVAALLFALIWTAVVGAAVLHFQPAAMQNFFGIAIWHTLAGLAVYGMIAAASLATEMRRKLFEQQLLATKAELGALRARLNPHFLFNTLHTINALVRRDPARAEAAIQQFGDLMHYVLEIDGSGLVPLEDELEFVRGYLAIESLRLGERLRTEENIEDEALDCGVPALLLQPLVENAVRHGIDQSPGGGNLRIGATVRADRLILSVDDDGVGSSLQTNETATGLGISTTRRQLEARYGFETTVTIVTSPSQGFRITLDMPALPAGREAP